MDQISKDFSGRATWGYKVDFKARSPGRIDVVCEAFPELSATGRDKGEAFFNVHAELDRVVAQRISRGLDVPPFDDPKRSSNGAWIATLRAIHVLKVELYMALRERGWTRADLMRRLGWHRNQVDRLFDFDRDTQLDQVLMAAHALGRTPNLRLQANLEGLESEVPKNAPALQLTHDGDGWRVRLAPEDPAFAGEPLTLHALPTKEDAELYADAIERALARLGHRIRPRHYPG